MVKKVQIKSKGIENVLKSMRITIPEAVAEYIWNGFDAGATKVELIYASNNNGDLTRLVIKDNGIGIPEDQLDGKFGPFRQSEKTPGDKREKTISLPHGYRGVGRLTFFQFAYLAKWTTTYQKGPKRYKYQIEIESKNLDNYLPKDTGPLNNIEETDEETGTIVEFDRFVIVKDKKLNITNEIINYLCREFGWFLELYNSKGFQLLINGKNLDYKYLIENEVNKVIVYNEPHTEFKVKFLVWNEMINKEYSYYYYSNKNDEEQHKETTTLNNQGDGFYHSVYVVSSYFDDFNFYKIDEKQQALKKDRDINSPTFKYLKNELDSNLKLLRKPFLKIHSNEIVEDFAQYNDDLRIYKTDDEFTIYKKQELINVAKELYQVQPKIFVRLNIEQQKTFIGLIKLLLDSDERDGLINILSNIIELTSDERIELNNLLKTNTLDRILKTIKLISDRYTAVESLKQLVFNKDLHANERDHLQNFIKRNYWIFGEQYSLATADKEFETALREYLYILDGTSEKVHIEHPNKRKRMDIFICKRDITSDSIHNIIVELKHPTISLGEKEVSQVKEYMRVIRAEPRFMDPTAKWDFILVGNGFHSSGYIEEDLKNMERYGRSGLIHEPSNNFSLYVKPWSQIIGEFEKRHDFLNKKLQVEKNILLKEVKDPVELIEMVNSSSASIY